MIKASENPLTSWFFVHSGQRVGPVDESEVVRRIQRGEIENVTLVWKKGMEHWKPAGETELLRHFQTDVPPLPRLPCAANAGKKCNQCGEDIRYYIGMSKTPDICGYCAWKIKYPKLVNALEPKKEEPEPEWIKALKHIWYHQPIWSQWMIWSLTLTFGSALMVAIVVGTLGIGVVYASVMGRAMTALWKNKPPWKQESATDDYLKLPGGPT